jgi:hypothetical protein
MGVTGVGTRRLETSGLGLQPVVEYKKNTSRV